MRQAVKPRWTSSAMRRASEPQNTSWAPRGWVVVNRLSHSTNRCHRSRNQCSGRSPGTHWYSGRANTSRTARRTESAGTPCRARSRTTRRLNAPQLLAQQLEIEALVTHSQIVVREGEDARDDRRQHHGEHRGDHGPGDGRRGGELPDEGAQRGQHEL